jgi:hypothetical protein
MKKKFALLLLFSMFSVIILNFGYASSRLAGGVKLTNKDDDNLPIDVNEIYNQINSYLEIKNA